MKMFLMSKKSVPSSPPKLFSNPQWIGGCWKPATAPASIQSAQRLLALSLRCMERMRSKRYCRSCGRCEWWECWGGQRGKGSWVGYSDWIGSWWHGSCWIMKWCWLILYVPSVTLHDQKENTSQQAMPHAGQQEIRITGTTLDQKIGPQTWLPKNACHPTNQSDPDRRKSVGFFLVGFGLKFPSWSYMISITTKISNSWAPHTSPNSAGDWEQP